MRKEFKRKRKKLFDFHPSNKNETRRREREKKAFRHFSYMNVFV